MFFTFATKRSIAAARADHALIAALSRSLATIEFDLDGRVLTANANFLVIMGYELAEIIGQQHRLFVPEEVATSQDYQRFWSRLRNGDFEAAEYMRLAKGGRPVWIQATYNPVLGEDGKPLKIVKVASDVTAAKLAAADATGQLAAISKSQAVIEFDLNGTILSANPNFCEVMGYQLTEIRGQHHRMFVDPGHATSSEYRAFWERLRAGQYQASEFLRLGKDGKQVWIQASYNPILDPTGKPYKVVKFATDVTARKSAVDAIGQCLAKLAEGNSTAN